MALYYTLPVNKDVYRLTLKVFEFTKEYPREYKYTLGQDIKRDTIELVRYIYKATSSNSKKESLEKFLEVFEIIKLEVRLSVD